MIRTSLILVKRAFPPDYLNQVREYAEEKFRQQAPASEKDQKRMRQGVAVNNTRFDPKWKSVWEYASPELLEFLASHPLLSYPSQVRWIQRQTQMVPWHQDYASEQHIGKVVTCFVPLNPKPGECSTLEFSMADDEIPHHPESIYGGFEVEQSFPHRTYFDLELGDCIVFGDLVPHRTFMSMDMQLERMSLEFRLISESERKLSKDYTNIVTGEILSAIT